MLVRAPAEAKFLCTSVAVFCSSIRQEERLCRNILLLLQQLFFEQCCIRERLSGLTVSVGCLVMCVATHPQLPLHHTSAHSI